MRYNRSVRRSHGLDSEVRTAFWTFVWQFVIASIAWELGTGHYVVGLLILAGVAWLAKGWLRATAVRPRR